MTDEQFTHLAEKYMDTVMELVGDHLYSVDSQVTLHGYTITLDSFIIDELGTGVIAAMYSDYTGNADQDIAITYTR